MIGKVEIRSTEGPGRDPTLGLRPGRVNPKRQITERGAVLSECGKYRYRLWRRWTNELALLNFIMLNPSTADLTQDDPTIRKCMGFAEVLGFGGIVVTNLFAFRATQPRDLFAAVGADLAGYDRAVGAENDNHLIECVAESGLTICGWGSCHPVVAVRGHEVRVMIATRYGGYPLAGLYALRTNRDGEPAHPLYLPYTCRPERLTDLLPKED